MSRTDTSLLDYLKSWPLALLPHQLLSRIVRRATRWQASWWKNFLINAFVRWFDVDMTEAQFPAAVDYPDFNSFFTRALKDDARPQPDDPRAVTSPVDGHVSACGRLDEDRILQAKGHNYSLTALLGGDSQRAAPFLDGHFATLYLSPRDYHRIHMPCSGQLMETVYIPGRLYSVAPHTTRAIDGLFTRNERLVSVFETAAGPMAMVMVGAIFVSCMETVWAGVVNPRMGKSLQARDYSLPGQQPATLQRGSEMGRFNMGSTVILLFGTGQVQWSGTLGPEQAISFGRQIGLLHPGNNA
jgi:phosphatidylserine decarboxylase